MFNKTYELCPFCEYEIELKCIKFKQQSCSNCGELIFPCSLCNYDEMNCYKCLIYSN